MGYAITEVNPKDLFALLPTTRTPTKAAIVHNYDANWRHKRDSLTQTGPPPPPPSPLFMCVCSLA